LNPKLESVGFVLMLGGLLLRDLWKLGILIFRHDPNSQFEFGYRDLVEIFIVVVHPPVCTWVRK
jgi:hypothetical protein